jgi:hypothetical protein
LGPKPQNLSYGQSPPPESHRKGFAFEEFEYQIVSVLVESNVVENADMGMLERGTGPSFADHLGGVCYGAVIMKNLYGDGATQLDVSGLVDLAHASRP